MNAILAGCFFVLATVLCAVNCELTTGCAQQFFACPEDCTKYYICLHGRLLKLSCAAGLHWNAVLMACDWPANANCVETPAEAVKPTVAIPTPKPDESKEVKKVICYCKY